jgi:hypothetical protein
VLYGGSFFDSFQEPQDAHFLEKIKVIYLAESLKYYKSSCFLMTHASILKTKKKGWELGMI